MKIQEKNQKVVGYSRKAAAKELNTLVKNVLTLRKKNQKRILCNLKFMVDQSSILFKIFTKTAGFSSLALFTFNCLRL